MVLAEKSVILAGNQGKISASRANRRTVPVIAGMDRARGWGKRSVSFQAKFTAIAVNLKRIAALWREGELRADAKAAVKPKSFPQAAPPDGCRRVFVPICQKNRENTVLYLPLFPLFSHVFA
ncbi:MAG: hypothetical protein II038_07405 [Lachnospiraceae bacterium]|nr:hypothetical protein [Lachnospiraceae bacterium]